MVTSTDDKILDIISAANKLLDLEDSGYTMNKYNAAERELLIAVRALRSKE